MKNSLIIFVFLSLSGCSVAPTPITYYTLGNPSVSSVSNTPFGDQSLQLLFPISFDIKLNQNLYFSNAPYQIGAYQQSLWSDSLGSLLEAYLFKALYASKVFKSVMPYTAGSEADYRLESRVVSFLHQIDTNSSVSKITFHFSIVSNHTGKQIKERLIDFHQETKSIDAIGYVEAVNDAMRKVVAELIVWLSDSQREALKSIIKFKVQFKNYSIIFNV